MVFKTRKTGFAFGSLWCLLFVDYLYRHYQVPCKDCWVIEGGFCHVDRLDKWIKTMNEMESSCSDFFFVCISYFSE